MGQSAASAAGSEFFMVCKTGFRPKHAGSRSVEPRPLRDTCAATTWLQVSPGCEAWLRWAALPCVIGQPRVRKLRVLHHQYALVWAACAAPKAAKLQLELLAAPSPAKTSLPTAVEALRTKPTPRWRKKMSVPSIISKKCQRRCSPRLSTN